MDSKNPRRYDVFLSFRGTDTRNTFTDHLYHHLIRKGIFVFKDDLSLQKGESISPQLLQAIQDSRVSIVVFSKDYASSSWCLEEMAAIVECRKQLKQTVIPVFYDVDPSHVRKQNGVFHDAFFSHTQKRFKHDPSKVEQWQIAMTELANLAGFDVRDKPEFIEIENIIQAVIKKLGHKFSWLTNDLIGIQPRVEELEKLLKLSSEDDSFRVLGIWGMGGIGKTTHARVLYDRISYQFNARCFIDNVSKIYRDGGAVAVQKKILRQALNEKDLDTYDTCEISGIIINRLQRNIKVLIVLDNVDQLEQLQELAITPKFLYSGSRVIITTRDEHILRVYEADKVHQIQLLNNNEAFELFCRKAFQREEQSSSCFELIPDVLRYTQHLPLAIRVVGSSLCTRDAIQWRDALDGLRNNPDNGIMEVLQMSVDGLRHNEKEIFLHIACFFKGEREDYVKRILDACELHPQIGIQRLVEKSLIKIINEEIHMHEMLQDLGKNIIRNQFPEDPGSWSRLWRYKDLYNVLMTETGTNNVQSIVLDQKENVSKCSTKGFSNMRNLKLLILNHNSFTGNLNFLSNNLQFLLWHRYPFTSLPSDFEPYYLVELNMPDSRIERLWEGRKDLPCLRRMDLSNSKYLIETPMFFGTPKLERLDFTGCTNLSQVHPSMGHLTKLAFLSLHNCSSLVCLDFGNVSSLCYLRVLRLSGCTNLKETPHFPTESKLEYLDMDGCASLSTVHKSIGALEKLKFLSLRGCTNLVEIPDVSVITLDLSGCLKLTTLTGCFTPTTLPLVYIVFLDVSFCNLYQVPAAIGSLQCLERLDLQGNKFGSLPDAIYKLERLAYLKLGHCHKLPSTLGDLFCPKMKFSVDQSIEHFSLWLEKLLEQPQSFRCGFDIILPLYWENSLSCHIPEMFYDQFDGSSKIKVKPSINVDNRWLGFAFCVEFEVNNHPANSGSLDDSFSSQLPHPFYLSFENDYTEERFDMPLSLELAKIDSSKYLWLIYISREHCHFVITGAHITFKACPGLLVKKWGFRMLIKKAKEDRRHLHDYFEESCACHPIYEFVEESCSSSGPKIQLPYNWFVTEKEEAEISQAKSKENDLSILGL